MLLTWVFKHCSTILSRFLILTSLNQQNIVRNLEESWSLSKSKTDPRKGLFLGRVKEFLKKHPPPPAHFCQWAIRHNKEIIQSKTFDVCKKTKKAKQKLPSCKGIFWAGQTWGFQSIFVFLENFSTVTAFTKTHFSRRLQKFN